MARRRKLLQERKEILRNLRESYNPKDADAVQCVLLDPLGDLM